MSGRVTKAISVTMQPRAECVECDWVEMPGRRVRDEAKWHVRSFGHVVIVITETRDEYRLLST